MWTSIFDNSTLPDMAGIFMCCPLTSLHLGIKSTVVSEFLSQSALEGVLYSLSGLKHLSLSLDQSDGPGLPLSTISALNAALNSKAHLADSHTRTILPNLQYMVLVIAPSEVLSENGLSTLRDTILGFKRRSSSSYFGSH